jgi:hypothetical protein
VAPPPAVVGGGAEGDAVAANSAAIAGLFG